MSTMLFVPPLGVDSSIVYDPPDTFVRSLSVEQASIYVREVLKIPS